MCDADGIRRIGWGGTLVSAPPKGVTSQATGNSKVLTRFAATYFSCSARPS